MNLLEKLLEIQISVDKFLKDGFNKNDKYNYVSSDTALETIRPKMNELRLLLEPSVSGHALHTGEAKSGTTRFMTEMDIVFTWIDVDSGETRQVPFYAQGVDLAGEKGVGKALTYAEKYFLMKYFHVPTARDDPDGDGRTKSGEKPQRGTQAAKENVIYFKNAIGKMLDELCGGDTDKIKQTVVAFTKSKERQFAGFDSIEDVPPAALPVIYAKMRKKYREVTGRDIDVNSLKTDGDS